MIDNGEDNKAGAPTLDIDPKVASLLCYLFGWIGGLIFFLIEKEDHRVRFHALQSIFFNIGISIIYISVSIIMGIIAGLFMALPGVNLFLILLPVLYVALTIIFLIIWVMLMVRAYNGEMWKLPIIGDIAEQNS